MTLQAISQHLTKHGINNIITTVQDLEPKTKVAQ